MAVTKKIKRRSTKNLNHGAAYIQATKSNTIITITDDGGNAIAWSSSGAVGFKGSKQKLLLQLNKQQKQQQKLQEN